MNIDEIKKAKINLELAIADLLATFEAESRVQITSVRVETLPVPDMYFDSRHRVSVKVEL